MLLLYIILFILIRIICKWLPGLLLYLLWLFIFLLGNLLNLHSYLYCFIVFFQFTASIIYLFLYSKIWNFKDVQTFSEIIIKSISLNLLMIFIGLYKFYSSIWEWIRKINILLFVLWVLLWIKLVNIYWCNCFFSY